MRVIRQVKVVAPTSRRPTRHLRPTCRRRYADRVPAGLPSYDLPYEHVYSGKVRDLYALPDGRLLIVACDRISAYDYVLPTRRSRTRARILTQMSLWWFEQLADLVPNHVLPVDVPEQVVPGGRWSASGWRCSPFECVARGYLAGSGLSTTSRPARSAASPLPPGLVDGSGCRSRSSRRPRRPTLGDHDENVDLDARRRRRRRGDRRAAARAHPRGLRPGERSPASGASSWPTPSSSSAGAPTATSSCWPTRCSPPTRRGSGRPTRGSPATRSRRTTSSTCATG